jgi:16S rRNA (uracil1498-N3)-methyltransferase
VETFYVHRARVGESELTLVGDEHRHLTKVVRAAPGDRISVVDGAGGAYDTVIVSISGTDVRCRIEARHRGRNELPMALTIAPALLKNPARFELIVEKATELGVVTIQPLRTARTIRSAAKAERWSAIALAAMKQSGRCVLPAVHSPLEFGDFLRTAPAGAVKLIPHERASLPLAEVLGENTRRETVICTGPEGGFTEAEIGGAVEAGFRPVSLGGRRLRAETAAIAALAAVVLTAA